MAGGRPATGSARWNPVEKIWEARISIPGIGRKPAPLRGVPACLVVPSSPPKGCSCASCAQARRCAKLVSDQARDEGRVPEGTAETVSEWFARYYDAAELGSVGKKNRGRPQASAGRRRAIFRQWIEPLIGTYAMSAITAADLRRIVQKLDTEILARTTFYAKGEAAEGRKPGIAPKTATGVWSEIVNGFGEATNSKLDELRTLETNPAIGVRPPTSGEEREQAALYPADIVHLLSSTDVSRECRRLYWAALYTGCRRSEIARLTAASIDLEHGVINVRGRKTNAARRTIPIEPGVRALFECLVRDRPTGPLFFLPGSDGGKGGTSSLIQRDLARSGIDREDLTRDDADHMPFTFHGLRHTAITHWAVAGHPLTWLLVVAGHTDAKMTQRYLDRAAVSRGHFGVPHPPLPADVVADILEGTIGPVQKRAPGRPKGVRKASGVLVEFRSSGRRGHTRRLQTSEIEKPPLETFGSLERPISSVDRDRRDRQNTPETPSKPARGAIGAIAPTCEIDPTDHNQNRRPETEPRSDLTRIAGKLRLLARVLGGDERLLAQELVSDVEALLGPTADVVSLASRRRLR